jgi:hypothetical protein
MSFSTNVNYKDSSQIASFASQNEPSGVVSVIQPTNISTAVTVNSAKALISTQDIGAILTDTSITFQVLNNTVRSNSIIQVSRCGNAISPSPSAPLLTYSADTITSGSFFLRIANPTSATTAAGGVIVSVVVIN